MKEFPLYLRHEEIWTVYWSGRYNCIYNFRHPHSIAKPCCVYTRCIRTSCTAVVLWRCPDHQRQASPHRPVIHNRSVRILAAGSSTLGNPNSIQLPAPGDKSTPGNVPSTVPGIPDFMYCFPGMHRQQRVWLPHPAVYAKQVRLSRVGTVSAVGSGRLTLIADERFLMSLLQSQF